jgi:hypothetical protein
LEPDPCVPEAFYEINTGVVAYVQSDSISKLFAQWHQTYLAWLDSPPFPGADGVKVGQDQPAFRRCVWDHRQVSQELRRNITIDRRVG